MKRYILNTLLVAILLSACAQAVAPQSTPTAQSPAQPLPSQEDKGVTPAPVSDDKLGGAVIIYQRSGGLAGVEEKWTIYADGRVVDAQGEERAIEAAQVSTLLGGIQALGFFEMKDSYRQFSQCNDCFTYTLTVSNGGKPKSVTTKDSATDTPPELWQVLDKINTLVSKAK